MKVVVFVIATLIFVGSLVLMGYSFEVGNESGLGGASMFLGGILGVSLAYAIPFHLLEKFD
ncbi:MAG: hypothetical protein ACTHMQ_03320 [Protaetiibacter sp.]